ncbi:MAG: polysaccharide pyruvyl transferase family protein [Clostridiales bacterium]|nr:polysaccharide pyruvyl transferase family protein [Clostridiales bacterium]
MGIPERDICYIGLRDVVHYRGEDLVLPINFSITDFVKDGRIAIPPQITPVFLAVQLSSVEHFPAKEAFLCDEYNKNYFLRHAPIGCRDEASYGYFTRNGIPAYINGCLTATFPKSNSLSGDSIVYVDAPKALLPWVPQNLLQEKALFATQQFRFSEDEIKDYRKIFDFIHSKYEFFRQNARLVVTSRLHVALPCTAFGIPVILARDSVDERFSFIEAYVPIYSREDYQSIDWSPKAPDIEPVKARLANLAISRIRAAKENMHVENGEDELFFTSMFETRKKREEYKDPHVAMHKNGYRFEEYALKNWLPKGTKPIKYALWGASHNNAHYWQNLIETKYPSAELVAVLDRYRKDELFGIPFETPDVLAEMPDVHVIVCAVSAVNDALALFARLSFEEERYCIVSDCFISETDIENRRLAAK